MSLSARVLAVCAILLLNSITTASPSPVRSGNWTRSDGAMHKNASYDNLPEVWQRIPLTTYDLLEYNGIDYQSNGLNGTDPFGNIAPSQPSFALYGGLSTSAQTPTTITTTTKCFQLQSFFAACSIEPYSDAFAIRTPCDITLSGYDVNGEFLGNETFAFEPKGLHKAVFPQFKVEHLGKAKYIEFSTVATAGPLVTTVMDNLVYVAYNSSSACTS